METPELPNEMLIEILNKTPKTIEGFKEKQRIISSIPNYNRNSNRIWHSLLNDNKPYDYRLDYQTRHLDNVAIRIADKDSIQSWAATIDLDIFNGITQEEFEYLFFDTFAKNYQDVVIPTQTAIYVDKKLGCRLSVINLAFILVEIMCRTGLYETNNQTIFDALDKSHVEFYPFINSELLKDIYAEKGVDKTININNPKLKEYFYYSLYICNDRKKISKIKLDVWEDMLENPEEVNERVIFEIEQDFKIFKEQIKFNDCEETDYMLE